MEPLVLTLVLALGYETTAEECREILFKTYPSELIQELANYKTTFNCRIDVMGRLYQIGLENDKELDRQYKREFGGKEIYEVCGDEWCRVEQRDPLLDRE